MTTSDREPPSLRETTHAYTMGCLAARAGDPAPCPFEDSTRQAAWCRGFMAVDYLDAVPSDLRWGVRRHPVEGRVR